eukprot:TRINITY_DN4882_c0_g1_i1.p2 TRINITY_DN4882_c0_g1~~TRINITY_DN4882_c0_g1_i1.p2  ORF type:complete len:286 (+),score=51.51 TRINITY_DN4882_c0_g1_i1:285-1142(+)
MRSGLSLTQTKQWFVNARRRLLPNVLQQTQTPPKRQPKLTQRLADIGGNVDSAILALPAPPAVSTLDLALPRSDLVVVPELGQGLVRRAYYRHAVVAVNISRNDKDKENLRREAELMCTLRHRNVVNTIGFCDGILITELSELGDCQLPDDAFFGRLGYDAKSLGDSCEMQQPSVAVLSPVAIDSITFAEEIRIVEMTGCGRSGKSSIGPLAEMCATEVSAVSRDSHMHAHGHLCAEHRLHQRPRSVEFRPTEQPLAAIVRGSPRRRVPSRRNRHEDGYDSDVDM